MPGMTDRLTPVTIVRAGRYEGSLDDALLRDARYAFVQLGLGRRFAYEATPSPHCLLLALHKKEYGAQHLGGGNLSLTVTGYDERLVKDVAAGLATHTGIELYEGVTPTLLKFMESSMNGSFEVIVQDPEAFIESQRTK